SARQDEDAKVSVSKESPDIVLGIKALAGLFSGMYSARMLANWGMLEADAAAIGKADRLFATTHAPHCPDHY
ncbi:MAG: hypothetical protein GWP70_08195, partial [Proteobacteria bacterium]|nr:hypothetical protein [Pseudomonadota bacterium]